MSNQCRCNLVCSFGSDGENSWMVACLLISLGKSSLLNKEMMKTSQRVIMASLSLFVMLCSIIIQNGSRFFPQNIQMRCELHREKIIGFWFHHQTNKYILTMWLLTRYNIIQNSTRHFPVFSNQTHTHAHVTNFIFFFALHCLQ